MNDLNDGAPSKLRKENLAHMAQAFPLQGHISSSSSPPASIPKTPSFRSAALLQGVAEKSA